MTDWIKKKSGTPSTPLSSILALKQRLRLVDSLVVYIGPLFLSKFKVYSEVAKEFMQ